MGQTGTSRRKRRCVDVIVTGCVAGHMIIVSVLASLDHAASTLNWRSQGGPASGGVT